MRAIRLRRPASSQERLRALCPQLIPSDRDLAPVTVAGKTNSFLRRASMRVAVLADIHGNLPALEAVLAEVEAAGVDAVVINGDMTFGPMPAETLDRLAELGDR